MSVVEEINIECSSNPEAGAKSVSPDGSFFEIHLSEPIHIPREARNCKVIVESAYIWWTILNFTEDNNVFHIKYNDDEYEEYKIDPGLYDGKTLQTVLSQMWMNEHGTDIPFKLEQNRSTQKIVLQFAGAENDVILFDFTQNDTPREILGFNSAIVEVNDTDHQFVNGDTIAMFNTVNKFHICGDLCQGMRVNNTYRNLLLSVPILARPGSQIVYEPYRPPRHNANELIGNIRNTLRFWLTNELGERVNTNSDAYGFRLKIEYTIRDD